MSLKRKHYLGSDIVCQRTKRRDHRNALFWNCFRHFILDLRKKSSFSFMRCLLCVPGTESSVGNNNKWQRLSHCPPGAHGKDKEQNNRVWKYCDIINTGAWRSYIGSICLDYEGHRWMSQIEWRAFAKACSHI